MTQYHELARRLAFAAAVACVFGSSVSIFPSAGIAKAKAKPGAQPAGPSAQGQQPSGEGGEKVAQQEAAKKAYDAGLKAYAAGKTQVAIEQLSAAVSSGALSPAQMAKALMTRGLAYKKDNKPGQSISDLTSAIWLKNGLSPSEQKSAIAERSEAYRMAGLPDTGSTPDQRAIGTPAPASGTAKPAAAAAAGPNSGSAGLSAAAIAEAAGAQKSESPGTAGQAPAQAASSTPLSSETTIQSAAAAPLAAGEAKPASSGIAGFFGFSQSPAAPEQQAPAAASSGSSFTGNVSNFFSNMFGGGSSAPAAPAQETPVVTASTGAAGAETSSWSNSTTVSTGAKAATLKAQKTSYAPEASVAAAPKKGKFKIHIAALRSKAEAEALTQKLVAEHGAELAGHVPVVDTAVIGSMGTFYRVRIAGYASQEEPSQLCQKLRSSGLDCLVVTN
jgi:hypothetical protein